MRLETCIRKGLGLKAHRVREVREEEGGLLVAEVERIAGRSLRCGCCGGPARQIHSRRFFSWLGKRRARSIQVVCCDMWSVYLEAVREHLPQATIVFDRFHVVQHLNRAVDEVRRQCWRQLSSMEKSAFKRTRWLWLKNPWNLQPRERRRLSALCRKNQPIVRAYYLKEAFQRFWDYLRRGWALPYLKHWLWWASHSRLESFKRFAKMIRTHLDGILAWTRLRVSNGALEGMNNKVKAVSHRAFGFRKPESYITAIWHCCGDLPLE